VTPERKPARYGRFAMNRLTAEIVSLSWIVKYVGSLFFFYSGLLWLFCRVKRMILRTPLRIIAYHGVDDLPNYLDLFMTPKNFEAQMRYLRGHYHIVDLDEALRIIEGNVSISRETIAITFDDGYKDNYQKLFPIIKKYGLPVAVFLTSDLIESGTPTFVYAAILLMENAKTANVDLSEFGLGSFALDTIDGKEKAVRVIDGYSKILNSAERQELLDAIIAKVGLSGHEDILAGKMLNWEEVRAMSQAGVAFGSHTCGHPKLPHLADADLYRELAGSKDCIENNLGKKVDYFAYPYGGRDALNDSVKQSVEKAGYRAAFVLFPDRLTPENKFSLGRKMVSHQMTSSPFNRFSKPLFACEMSGLFDFLLLRRQRSSPR
jgi:peptidoglycan/xylan/chitin deacetylase (PgdA/CDA1 family)